MGTTVALTVLKPPQTEPAALASFLDRFLQEFNFVSRVDHENVVRVLDYGIFERRAFLVTAGCEGKTLRSLLTAEGTLGPERVVAIANQVCAALSAAHQGGIIHGDLQPDSIFIIPSSADFEHCKVADFALAKVLRGEDSTLAILTRTGKTVGSPYYMSPEIFRGKPGDARSDVYSLGIVLYELLCGHVPFQSTSMMDLLLQHLNEPPPPIPRPAEGQGVSDALAAVVAKALEKNPANRYDSIWGITQALREAIDCTDAKSTSLFSTEPIFEEDTDPLPSTEIHYDSADDVTTDEDQIVEVESLFLDPSAQSESEDVANGENAVSADSTPEESGNEEDATSEKTEIFADGAAASSRPAENLDDSRFRRAVGRYERSLARKREIRRKRLILAGSIAAFVITVTIFFVGLYHYVEANKPVSTFLTEQEKAAQLALTPAAGIPAPVESPVAEVHNEVKEAPTEVSAAAQPTPLAEPTPTSFDEIGISVLPVTEAVAKANNLRTPQGLLVTDIAAKGHPARTKLKKGDVIRRIETRGEPALKWKPFEIDSPEQLGSGIKQAKATSGRLSMLLRRGDGKDILAVIDFSVPKPDVPEKKKPSSKPNS